MHECERKNIDTAILFMKWGVVIATTLYHIVDWCSNTYTHTHKHTYIHTHKHTHIHTNTQTHTQMYDMCTRVLTRVPSTRACQKHTRQRNTSIPIHTTMPRNSSVALPSCCGGQSWHCAASRLCASLPYCGSSWGHVGVRRGSIWYHSLLVLSTNSGNRMVTRVWNSIIIIMTVHCSN